VQGRRDASLGDERRQPEGLSTHRGPADPAVVATLRVRVLATQPGPEGPRSDCNSDTQKGARAVCSGARAPRTLLHGRAALRQR